jgi:hypothetical protein
VNLQIGLWRKEVLVRILQHTRNPWEFEMDGSKYSNKMAGEFCCINRERDLPIERINALIKGRIAEPAQRLLSANGFDDIAESFERVKKYESDYLFSAKRILRKHVEYGKYIIGLR